jgi:hypothetical protein
LELNAKDTFGKSGSANASIAKDILFEKKIYNEYDDIYF